MLDFTPAYTDIRNHLKTELDARFGNVRVFDTNVPLDVAESTVNGLFSPYVVLSIGGGIRAARGRSIVNSRYDVMQYWVVATVVGPENLPTMVIKSAIIDILTGFVPTDASELTPEGGQAQSSANENRIPIIYQQRAMFQFFQNMET